MRPKKTSAGEFDLIARLIKDIRISSRTILGPGDDCAILAPGKRAQLFTIDSMVEGVHFQLEWGTPEQLGAKALSVNLSDIAAMGGRPLACVINLGVRDGLAVNFFERVYRGLKRIAAKYQTDIVGGNVTRSDQLSITIALLGVASDGMMRRDRARVGQDIFVTGTLGDSAAGLAILNGKMKARERARKFLVERHLNPTPRIEAGLALARIRPTPAAIDISDGLLQDLGHILKRSRVGAEIDAAAIPVSDSYRATMGDDRTLAVSGGEDYELLFCASRDLSERKLETATGVPVHRIGKIVKGTRIAFRGTPGLLVPEFQGWDQLRASS